MITPNAIANKANHEREVNAIPWVKCSEMLPYSIGRQLFTIRNKNTEERYLAWLNFNGEKPYFDDFDVIAWFDDTQLKPYQGEA